MQKESEPISRMKVSIVDDDKKLCKLVLDYLKPMDYDIDAAYAEKVIYLLRQICSWLMMIGMNVYSFFGIENVSFFFKMIRS